MKSKLTKALVLAAATLVLTGVRAYSQHTTYSAEGRTTVSALDNTSTNRLFSDAAFTFLVPTNTIIWWVADTLGNGVPIATANPITHQGVLGADDVLIFGDVVDGTLFGNAPGKYARTLTVPVGQGYENAHIYFYLWNATNNPPQPFGSMDKTNSAAGPSFGLFDTGVNPDPFPNPGNPSWFVSANIFSSQFVLVPEPTAVALAGLGLIGMVTYRRFRK